MNSFRHSGSCGDVIYSLPTCLALSKGEPFDLFLQVGVPAHYPASWTHPSGNLRLSEGACSALLPLLRSQKYVKSAERWEKQLVHVNLDRFRSIPGVDFGWSCIPKYHLWSCNAWWDLSKPWMQIDAEPNNKILVCRTSRYRNPRIDYTYLRRYGDCVFVGVESEVVKFRQESGWEIPWERTNTFLDLARLIAGCRLWCSNATCGFAIAEALKVNRILEIGTGAHNVVPMGPGGYDAVTKESWQAAVREVLR